MFNTSFKTCNTSLLEVPKINLPTCEDDAQLFNTFCTLNDTLTASEARVAALRLKLKNEKHTLAQLNATFKALKENQENQKIDEKMEIDQGWLRQPNYDLSLEGWDKDPNYELSFR